MMSGQGTPPPCMHATQLSRQRCAWAQVSFFRANLVLKVVKKPTGKTPDGKPAVLDALVNYITCAAAQCRAMCHSCGSCEAAGCMHVHCDMRSGGCRAAALIACIRMTS